MTRGVEVFLIDECSCTMSRTDYAYNKQERINSLMFPTLSTIIPGPSHVPLYLETYGDPAEKQTLFMVHGGFQSLRCFQQQFAALSEHFYIIALDLPYHGRSWPIPSSVQPDPTFWAQSIRAVLAHLQRLSSPLVIAAWSFGGLVVRNYLLTREQEENLIGLVFISSLFGGIDAYLYLQDEAAAQVISKLTMQRVSLPQKFAAFEQFIEMLTAYPLPFMERDIQYGYNVKAFLHSLSCTDSWFQEISCDQQQFLGKLRLPVLLIQGLEDALVPVSYWRAGASSPVGSGPAVDTSRVASVWERGLPYDRKPGRRRCRSP